MKLRIRDYLNIVPTNRTPEQEAQMRDMFERMREFCRDKNITIGIPKSHGPADRIEDGASELFLASLSKEHKGPYIYHIGRPRVPRPADGAFVLGEFRLPE